VLLFFGSYIDLQAPQVIVEAAHRYSGPAVVWQMVGEGPLRKECEKLARGLDNLHFLPQLPYSQLPEQIASSDIVLGVFGAGAKAGRVVPNKVAQGLACARPVITRSSSGYPAGMVAGERGGLFPIAPDDPDALADMVALLANRRQELPIIGAAAAANFRENLGRQVIRGELQSLFDRLAAVADGTQRAP
jgi:glycosyltransferase involved in cell wall biosynthesis